MDQSAAWYHDTFTKGSDKLTHCGDDLGDSLWFEFRGCGFAKYGDGVGRLTPKSRLTFDSA